MSCPEERKRYFLNSAVAFTDRERLVGYTETDHYDFFELLSKQTRLPLAEIAGYAERS